MADKYMLEEMLENLVNENTEKASELFHEFVVAKSREIYERLLAEADHEEPDDDDFGGEGDGDEDDLDFGGDETDDLHGELDDTDGGEFDDSDMDSDDDEFGQDEFGEFDSETPDELLQDLEEIVDVLHAKFAELKDGKSDGLDLDKDSDDFGGDEFGSDDEEGSDDFGGDEFGSDDEEEITDSFEPQLSTVREYVEKVGTDWGKSPKMGENGHNTKSIVAGKNDMGGTTANIARGGAAKGEGTKGGFINPSAKKIESGNLNVPGGDASKKAFSKKEKGWPENKGGDDGQNTSSLFRNKR